MFDVVLCGKLDCCDNLSNPDLDFVDFIALRDLENTLIRCCHSHRKRLLIFPLILDGILRSRNVSLRCVGINSYLLQGVSILCILGEIGQSLCAGDVGP